MRLPTLPLLALGLTLAAACASTSRLPADDADLDRVYERALRRAERTADRPGRRADERLAAYLLAHDAIQRRDLWRVRALASRTAPTRHADLYHRYRDLHARSLDLLAVDPAAEASGMPPELRPAVLARARDEAADRAGGYYLARAAPRRRVARLGDKPAAREAFALVDSAAYFLPGRAAELARARDTLRDLGTLRIRLRAAEFGGAPALAIARSLAGRGDLHRGWTSIVAEAGGARVDLEAEVHYLRSSGSGPSETCSSTTYSEEVLDYVERKTVCERVDDSTVVQRVVEVEHFETVYATVTECEQSASARAFGHVVVYRPGGRTPVRSLPLATCATWEHEYEIYAGDDRALPAGCLSSGRPAHPPSRGRLLAAAQGDLAGAARGALAQEYAPHRRKRAR